MLGAGAGLAEAPGLVSIGKPLLEATGAGDGEEKLATNMSLFLGAAAAGAIEKSAANTSWLDAPDFGAAGAGGAAKSNKSATCGKGADAGAAATGLLTLFAREACGFAKAAGAGAGAAGTGAQTAPSCSP